VLLGTGSLPDFERETIKLAVNALAPFGFLASNDHRLTSSREVYGNLFPPISTASREISVKQAEKGRFWLRARGGPHLAQVKWSDVPSMPTYEKIGEVQRLITAEFQSCRRKLPLIL
jgi:hypothetical protein